jgi:hypothetical protein
VILFGFLILAMATYQVQFVPMENEEIEFEHSQQVEGEFLDLRNAILQAGSTGSAQSKRIQLGTRYPQRTFFLNPPPASGKLETIDAGEIRFENVSVEDDGNVEEYWENHALNFTTSSLQYRPDYNEYRGAPSLTYEHSTIAAEFDNEAVLLRSEQTVVRGEDPSNRSFSLTMLSGDVSENGVEPRSVDFQTVSQGTRTVTVSGGSDGWLVLPTAVENETKLAEEWDQRTPVTVDPVRGEDKIKIKLDGTYPLRLSEVSMDGRTTTTPAYITRIGPKDISVGDTATAEVRDKYNNPVQDTEVTININESTERIETDVNGQIQYTIEEGDSDVSFQILDGSDWKSVNFTVRSTPTTPGNSQYNVTWRGSQIDTENNDAVTYSGDTLEVNRSAAGGSIRVTGRVENNGRPLDGATVDFATTNPSVAEFSDTSNTSVQGDFRTTLTISETGDTTLLAASGDGVDEIDVEVIQPAMVETAPASSIGQTEATLNGDLTDLGTADNASVSFQYRETVSSDWINTTVQTRSAASTFSETITGLESNTEYEFRAVAESVDRRTVGSTEEFTTDAQLGTVSGTITDAETGDPIGNAEVTVYEGDSTDAADEVTTTTTATDGTYSVDVTPGDYTVEVAADSYTSESQFPVEVDENADVTVDFALESARVTFESLEAEVSNSRGGGTEAQEITFTYVLSEEAPEVTLSVEDGLGRTFETSESENTGEQTVTLNLPNTPRNPTNNFPLEVTADIDGGERLTAQLSNSNDVARLEDNDWEES